MVLYQKREVWFKCIISIDKPFSRAYRTIILQVCTDKRLMGAKKVVKNFAFAGFFLAWGGGYQDICKYGNEVMKDVRTCGNRKAS